MDIQTTNTTITLKTDPLLTDVVAFATVNGNRALAFSMGRAEYVYVYGTDK